jgi:inner membrane protein
VKRGDHVFSTFLFSIIFYYYTVDYFFPSLKGTFYLYLIYFVLVLLTSHFSWLPDIDIRIILKIKKECKKRGLLNKIKCFILYPVSKIFRHRTITHSLLFLSITFFLFISGIGFIKDNNIIFILYKILTISIFFGILFHIIEDMFTVRGVPLLYPFSMKSFRIFKFNSSNEIHNWAMRVIVILIFIFWIYLEFFSDTFFIIKNSIIEVINSL